MATIGVRELKRTSQVLTRSPRLARRAIEALLRLVRGADAVSIAAAARLRLPLVTWDVEQRDGAARVVPVLVPEP